eukprot:SAG22_NODE_2335_length_2702_cov_10.861698_3_plen_104_part_00
MNFLQHRRRSDLPAGAAEQGRTPSQCWDEESPPDGSRGPQIAAAPMAGANAARRLSSLLRLARTLNLASIESDMRLPLQLLRLGPWWRPAGGAKPAGQMAARA